LSYSRNPRREFDLTVIFLSGGSGFFPLAFVNDWWYVGVTTPVESRTWGAVKALYE